MRAKVAAIFFLLLALIVSGCSQPQQFGGRATPKPVVNVVSLSPSATEILMGYAYELILVGRTQACNYPPGIENTEVVASVKPNYERITALKPDLIIYDSTLYSEKDIEPLKATNALLFDFRANSLEEYIAKLREFSVLTSSESRISELTDKIYAQKEFNKTNAPAKKPKVTVLISDGKSEFMAAGLQSFQADVIKNSGGEPVGPDGDKFMVYNVETLITSNPDIILTNGSAELILKDARLAPVNAVKNKRVVNINADVLLRAGNRVEPLLKQLGEFIRTSSK